MPFTEFDCELVLM